MGDFEAGNWNPQINSLNEGLSLIYETKAFSDVVYSINGHPFKCHELIMASRSSECERLQKSHQPGETIPITDKSVTTNGFSNLLHFIYKDSFESFDKASVIETYYAAKYFKLQTLLVKCVNDMDLWTMSTSEVIDLLAKGSKILTFKRKCIEFIKNNSFEVLESSYFLLCNLETMKIILESSALSVPPMELIKYIMKWGQTYLNLPEMQDCSAVRNLLLSHACAEQSMKLLATLGFENLSIQELAEDIPTMHPNLLTADEIIKFTTGKKTKIFPDWCKQA